MRLVHFQIAFCVSIIVSLMSSGSGAASTSADKSLKNKICEGYLGHIAEYLSIPDVVKSYEIPQFQKVVLDNFEAKFGYRPRLKFDLKSRHGRNELALVDPNGLEIAMRAFTIERQGTSVGLIRADTNFLIFRQMRLQELVLSEVLRRHPEIKRASFGFSDETNYRTLRDGIKAGLPYDDALAGTPAAKMLARFGFIVGPKDEQDREFSTFRFVKSPRVP